MDEPRILVRSLRKQFGALRAVDDVSFSVPPGEIFGFLGPNGAGKTTTIRMLTGLLQSDGGSIKIQGWDMAVSPLQCKAEIGYIADRPFLYEKLTGIEFLRFAGGLYGVSKEQFDRIANSYLELFDLHRWQDHLIESYSHGMRQKLVITSALLHNPSVLVVDEPMVGLDPKSARIVKEVFKEQARAGCTIFLSTHSLEIAEELCDRIAIIVEGRIRAMGTIAELRDVAESSAENLEEIFMELTGAFELQDVVRALRTAEGGV